MCISKELCVTYTRRYHKHNKSFCFQKKKLVIRLKETNDFFNVCHWFVLETAEGVQCQTDSVDVKHDEIRIENDKICLLRYFNPQALIKFKVKSFLSRRNVKTKMFDNDRIKRISVTVKLIDSNVSHRYRRCFCSPIKRKLHSVCSRSSFPSSLCLRKFCRLRSY